MIANDIITKINCTLKTLGKISDDKSACLTEETQK